MTAIVGLGAGGHAKILLEMLAADGRFEVVGFIDADPSRWGATFEGHSILGGDARMAELRAAGVETAFMGLGAVSVEGTHRRERLYREARELGFEFPTLVHPRAIVSPGARVGAGSVVMAGAIVSAAAAIGVNACVYSAVVVEHASVVGDHAHLSPGVVLAGGVTIGEGAFVGIGASIIQGVHVGARATIGAGAAVLSDVPPGAVVVGVPARIVKEAGMIQ